MKKQRIYRLAVIPIFLINLNAAGQQIELINTTRLTSYPSASAIEFYNNRLYVIGDDAVSLLVLNANHEVLDSVPLFRSDSNRMTKEDKADLEAATVADYKEGKHLLVFSSFSTKGRNKLLAFPLDNLKEYDRHSETEQISLLEQEGIKQVNIEGAAVIKDKLLLCNRANETERKNFIVVYDWDGKKLKNDKDPKVISLQLPKTKTVMGLSGLTYVKGADLLLFTASAEKTDNAYDDGEIGESFLGFIRNASQKMGGESVAADGLVNLSRSLKIGRQKIESVCAENASGNELTLHLAADNDNGESILYKTKFRL